MRFGLRLFSTGTNGTLVAISTTLLMPQAPQSPNPFVGISAVLSKLFVKSVLCVRSRVVKTRPSKISWTILPCRLLYSFASRKSFHFLLPLLSYPHYPTSLQHFRQCGVFKNFWHMLAPSFKKTKNVSLEYCQTHSTTIIRNSIKRQNQLQKTPNTMSNTRQYNKGEVYN